MEREEMLKKVPIFTGLDRKHIAQLSRIMVPRTFKVVIAITPEARRAISLKRDGRGEDTQHDPCRPSPSQEPEVSRAPTAVALRPQP